MELGVRLLSLGGIDWKSFVFGWDLLEILMWGGIGWKCRLWVDLVGNLDFRWNSLEILLRWVELVGHIDFGWHWLEIFRFLVVSIGNLLSLVEPVGNFDFA